MLISIARHRLDSPEDVEMNASLVSDGATQDFESTWFGHPFRLRAVLRDGTQVALAMSLTECAELHLLFNADDTIRSWADMMEARMAARDGTQGD